MGCSRTRYGSVSMCAPPTYCPYDLKTQELELMLSWMDEDALLASQSQTPRTQDDHASSPSQKQTQAPLPLHTMQRSTGDEKEQHSRRIIFGERALQSRFLEVHRRTAWRTIGWLARSGPRACCASGGGDSRKRVAVGAGSSRRRLDCWEGVAVPASWMQDALLGAPLIAKLLAIFAIH